MFYEVYTSASLFHYPPWSFGMPSLSIMSIPSMVNTSKTNISFGYIQKPSLMSGMRVPIQSSVLLSVSLTLIKPSIWISMPLFVSQYAIGSINVGGKPFVGPSFPTWGNLH
jgi:hypothetical protein